jgi:glucosylceramidase
MFKSNYKIVSKLILVALFSLSCESKETEYFPPPAVGNVNAKFYLTTSSKSSLLELQTNGMLPYSPNSNFTINVSENTQYQSIDGFGYSLTGASAQLINNMSNNAQNTLLQELFGQGENSIGVSYLRISIGASDLDINLFSYNDLPAGQTDLALNNFSIDPDLVNLIPILTKIKQINPNIKILATPWSAPSWMKTNGLSVGGELKTNLYATYANYFVKYIQAMRTNGINIDAISIQNEPENQFNNPSMLMNAAQQTNFIKNNLGPTFATNNIQTKIIIFDHNLDNPNYPISILNDNAANQYIDGSAFHLYAGQIDNMSAVHNSHPNKNLYFTELWTEAPSNFAADLKFHIREVIIGASRNWSKATFEWNLASNATNSQFLPGGCTNCLGAITIDGNNVTKNTAYYVIAHAAKFIPSGSKRIQTNSNSELPNVAFKTPQGKIVVIVLNNTDSQKSFNINGTNEPISTSLAAGSVGTFVF